MYEIHSRETGRGFVRLIKKKQKVETKSPMVMERTFPQKRCATRGSNSLRKKKEVHGGEKLKGLERKP